MLPLEALILSALEILLVKNFAATNKHGQCILLRCITVFQFFSDSVTFCCDFQVLKVKIQKGHAQSL